MTALLAGLIMLEPDLGTTIVLLLVTMALLWVVGAPVRLFAAISTTVAGLTGLLIYIEPYRMARFTGFLNPFADPLGRGFQAIQGLYALSSGGWWGIGLGASKEKWLGGLPNAHTDYVFAIIGEELGLVGTFTVLLLFATLAYAGIRTARRTTDPFVRLAATAVTAWLVGQAVVNVGAVVGLLPITGIPLPLISFGGSALLPTLFAVGMLASFARTEPGAAAALAARTGGPLSRWRRSRRSGTPPVPGGRRRRLVRRCPHPPRPPAARRSSSPPDQAAPATSSRRWRLPTRYVGWMQTPRSPHSAPRGVWRPDWCPPAATSCG